MRESNVQWNLSKVERTCDDAVRNWEDAACKESLDENRFGKGKATRVFFLTVFTDKIG